MRDADLYFVLLGVTIDDPAILDDEVEQCRKLAAIAWYQRKATLALGALTADFPGRVAIDAPFQEDDNIVQAKLFVAHHASQQRKRIDNRGKPTNLHEPGFPRPRRIGDADVASFDPYVTTPFNLKRTDVRCTA